MDNTWILVANASVAKLYRFSREESSKKKPQLTLVEEFEHPDSRKKDDALASDRLGDYASRGGHGSFVDSSDPHQHEATVFARELFQKLEQGRVTHQFQSLVLVAAPHFMGLLRHCMDARPMQHMSIQEVQKDYTQERPDKLIALLDGAI